MMAQSQAESTRNIYTTMDNIYIYIYIYISGNFVGMAFWILPGELFSQVYQFWSNKKFSLKKLFVIDFGWMQHADPNHHE